MIKVEKKFILTAKDIEKVLEISQFVDERLFRDIYYDTDDYFLSQKDIWLRSREENFELKVPVYSGLQRKIDQYEFVIEDGKILQKLGIVRVHGIKKDLEVAGYIHFCDLKTTRKKYLCGEFSIDLDFVECEDFTYNIAEIGLTIMDESLVKQAVEKILEFSKSLGLKDVYVNGKVREYLKQKRPDHYKVLLNSGMIKEY